MLAVCQDLQYCSPVSNSICVLLPGYCLNSSTHLPWCWNCCPANVLLLLPSGNQWKISYPICSVICLFYFISPLPLDFSAYPLAKVVSLFISSHSSCCPRWGSLQSGGSGMLQVLPQCWLMCRLPSEHYCHTNKYWLLDTVWQHILTPNVTGLPLHCLISMQTLLTVKQNCAGASTPKQSCCSSVHSFPKPNNSLDQPRH